MRIANVKEIKGGAKGLEKEVAAIVANAETSKSSKMKDLFELGMDIKGIATKLDVRYNFVYNVVSNYINTNTIEIVNDKGSSKKDTIVELFKAGKTNKEISAELKVNYNYVFKVLKEFKLAETKATIEAKTEGAEMKEAKAE